MCRPSPREASWQAGPLGGFLLSVRQSAYEAYAAGLCIVPPQENGSKAPLADAWKHWQIERPSGAQLEDWYRDDRRQGLGIICGHVSGDLECLEFEDEESWNEYQDLALAAGLHDLLEKVVAGYSEASPGGGVHLLYRCEVTGRNTKLARRPKRPVEMKAANDKTKTLIETRGEGGYVIVAPSHGRIHPSGEPYRLLRGGFESIVGITADAPATVT